LRLDFSRKKKNSAGQSFASQGKSAFHPYIRFQTLVLVNDLYIQYIIYTECSLSSWPYLSASSYRLSIRNLAIPLFASQRQAPQPLSRYPTVQTRNSDYFVHYPLLNISTLENTTSFGQVPLNQAVDIKLKTCVECGNEWMLQTSPNATMFKVDLIIQQNLQN
jgi:hypothetical protein